MTLPPRERIAINPLQWATPRLDPADPLSERAWLFPDPGFVPTYAAALHEVKGAGFDAVSLEVLPTQTTAEYARIVADAGLALAPGYAAIDLPDELPAPGSSARSALFDDMRRKAEESVHFGLNTIFLAPAMTFREGSVRTQEAAAIGAGFDADRLDRMTEVIGEAADVFAAAGVRAGLHNHIGTWVETVAEIDHVLAAIDPSRLGASFDIGHLAWLGVDPADVLRRHSDRLIDLHIKDLDLGIAAASRDGAHPYSWGPSRGLFREPGLGDMDLDAILAALPEGFGGWIVVEVDSTDLDPTESVRLCARWADATFA
ncbi:sugar phosphate isomerase/epimerase [Microbacterium sp. cx-59]|uniref:sugar phosphate isomerase/epimerase family protein n=1 Tax=Microbacterium sp. cx-59 TaxID=2891207 RepID=UPI001E59AA87|nr:sugar phosphate isomerase/epimerase [Microbacterium sp. cx-59]MCC4909217.1 sugar phosphate isomerase/epimerase [Microbacterium sp. cx-59]